MNSRTKKIILSAILVVSLFSLMISSACAEEAPPPPAPTPEPPVEEKFEWKLIYFAPAGDFYQRMAVDYCDRVRAMSNGRLDITPYP
jgi:TRAP-type C4-dicarboxylate transport system substrate-binding protein